MRRTGGESPRSDKHNAAIPVVILPEPCYVQQHSDHCVPLIRVDEFLEGGSPALRERQTEDKKVRQ